MSPTRRAAWVLAALAVVAIFVPLPIAVLAVVAIVAASIVDAFAARRRIEVTRVVAPVVSRGIAAPFTISVAAGVSGRVELRQPVPTALRLTPDESADKLDAVMVPRRRGRYELPPPVVRRTGPLGLGRWDRTSTLAPVELAVFPDLVSARALVNRVRRGRFGSAGRQARGPLGLGTEFELIREYAPDDDVRQINWRATARLGRPMSNQYRVEQDRDVVCLLDMGRLMTAPVGDRSRLDVALRCRATAVGLVADELGDRFGVVAADSEIRRRVAPAPAQQRCCDRRGLRPRTAATDTDYEIVPIWSVRAKRARRRLHRPCSTRLRPACS